MSQPQPPRFHTLKVLDTHRETPELTHLTLGGIPREVLQSHTLPGQYVQIEVPGQKPGFFALANRPGGISFELLIKRGAPVADAIAAVPTGGSVTVSAPAGKGYPLEALRGQDVLLAGVGSAMAPLRAAIQEMLSRREAFGGIDFYYGARGADWIPYATEVRAWANNGVRMHYAYSVLNTDGTFSGERIQDLLLREKPALSARAGVLACGMKSMVADVTAACGQLGLPAERVYQNF